MRDVVVREADAEDAEGFVRAHEEAWNATLGPVIGSSLDDLAPFDARVDAYRASIGHASQDVRAFVGERAGQIVGIAVVRRGDAESVELKDLYVVPAAWGTGVASTLMEAALASVPGEDAYLWVAEANGRARRFYEREGWIADGETRSSQLGPREVRYRRRSPDSAT